MKKIILVLQLFLFLNCSSINKYKSISERLTENWKGKSGKEVINKFGAPFSINYSKEKKLILIYMKNKLEPVKNSSSKYYHHKEIKTSFYLINGIINKVTSETSFKE